MRHGPDLPGGCFGAWSDFVSVLYWFCGTGSGFVVPVQVSDPTPLKGQGEGVHADDRLGHRQTNYLDHKTGDEKCGRNTTRGGIAVGLVSPTRIALRLPSNVFCSALHAYLTSPSRADLRVPWV